MRALTIYQPWATLIAAGIKRYETRSWAPPAEAIGGELAIHAGQAEVPFDDLPAALRRELDRLFGTNPSRWFGTFPHGAVVCTCRLTGAYRLARPDNRPNSDPGLGRLLDICAAVPGSRCAPEIRVDAFGDFSPGRWAWRLEDIRALHPPIHCRGYQRLWTWDGTAGSHVIDTQTKDLFG